MKQENILERVYSPGRLRMAWQQVRKNAGAAGIDKMTVDAFDGRADELLTLIHGKLKAGTYRFRPARRVLIPKEGSSKKRKLGIPVVMDRIVSQSVNLVFEGIFDPAFIRHPILGSAGVRASMQPLSMFRPLYWMVMNGVHLLI